MTKRLVILTSTAAVLTQLIVTGLTALSPDGGFYGAPLSVGRSFGISFLSGPSGVTSFQPLPFAANLVVSLGVLLVAARYLRIRTGGWMIAGTVAGTVVLLVTLTLMESGLLPFGGLPLPVQGRLGDPNALTLWLDLMIWTVALGWWTGSRASLRSRAVKNAPS